MTKSPTDSKIPIFHTNPLKSKISKPLSTLSSRLRAHLDADSRISPSSVLFGFLGTSNGHLKNAKTITTSHNTKNARHATGHDDLETAKSLTRPTNIFISGHHFPSAPATGQQDEYSITGAEHVGRRVRLNSGKEGVLRFVGKTQFGEGVWCGVELDNEEGTSDGTVNNIRYFSCPNKRGIFVLISNLSLVSEEVREYVSDVSEWGLHNLLGVTGTVKHLQNDSSDKPSSSDVAYFHKESTHQTSQTPTPNSSNSSFVAPCEWICNSRHSSSSSLLLNSLRGLPSSLDPLSVHMSKHSSIEYEDSLGILTPDQMAELTTYQPEVSTLSGGSCDDFRSLDGAKSLDVTDCKNLRCPSMENIMNTPMPAECLIDVVSDGGQNEALDRLFSETDTCIMSSSSISDQLEMNKDAPPRSPSAEELLTGDLSTTLVGDLSTTLLAPEQSAPATSFVTSVTSIGSWDNGYQGDGECSRPTSRGADASPLSRTKVPSKPPLEPMTDSDFFTESDADLYEDMSCLRGDRKARVIDGKLFGSPNHTKITTSQMYNSQILSTESCSGCVPEEMDSSGIFSDMEKKSDVTEKTPAETSDIMMTEDRFSDTSVKSLLKSVSSPKLVNCEKKENVKEAKSKEVEKKVKSKIASSKSNSVTTKQENSLKRRNDVPAKGKNSKSSSLSNLNKPKMPRRNVVSKVKTMISASSKCSEDENQENQPLNEKLGAKKGNAGKWDSILCKIEKSKTQEKLKADKLKDVKCKVVCNMPSKLHKDVKPFSPNGNAINKVQNSCPRQKENNAHRFKLRKTRNRINDESPVQSSTANTTAPVSLSRASSRNSSVTDISDSHMDLSQHSLPAVIVATGKKASPLCSPLSESGVVTVPLQSIIMASTKDMKVSSLPDTTSTMQQRQIRKSNSLVENPSRGQRKITYLRTLPKVASLKNQNRLQTSNSGGSCAIKNATILKPLSDHSSRPANVGYKAVKSKPKQSKQIVAVNPLLGRLKRATDGMEAFIVLYQRLTSDMDVFALPHIKRELTKYKEEWMDMKLKLEGANVSCRKLQEEIDMQKVLHDQKIHEVREAHLAELDKLRELHQREIATNSEGQKKQLKELNDRLEKQEMSIQLQFDDNLRQIQNQAEQKLESILEETKNQVNMLKIENDVWKEKLIKESWKKLEQVEAKFKSKMERMETSYLNQLSEADEEARKREELFLKAKRKKGAFHGATEVESNFSISKSYHESSFHSGKQDLQNMEEEVCSLRVVLDLKHSEIQDLRKQNEKLRKDVQDLPFISQKLDSAQARIEDLNAQLQTKIEHEKQLLKENRKLLETVQHESEKRKRVAFQNEELLWKLKKSAQVAKTLAVFNSGFHKDKLDSELQPLENHSSTPKNTKGRCQRGFNERTVEKQLKRSRTDVDIKLVESPTNGDDDDDDDDTSPKVLGVVEKNDSVSWVLEIDETPLTVASRMLRRASSLRGIPSNNKKKSNHTQQSLTLPSRNKKLTTNTPKSANSGDNEVQTAPTNGDAADVIVDEKTNSSSSERENEDENVIDDVASFFAFLQDSDFETDLVVSDVEDANQVFSCEKDLASTFSSNMSSDCSLDLDLYDKEIKSDLYPAWTKNADVRKYGDDVDTGDSQSVDIFVTSPQSVMLNGLVNSSTNSSE